MAIEINETQATAIPEELRTRPQWVPWKYGPVPQKNGKYPKLPCNARTGRIDDETNPRVWVSYEQACDAEGTYDGIGFCVSSGDPYTGIDLDHCRDKETGEIAAWAQSVIDRFNTYTEVSPSGTGVRLWLRGVKPGARCKQGGREVYDHRRFFTVTGQHLDGTPLTIE